MEIDAQKIDIGSILTTKFGRRLPRMVLRFVERLIHQDEINDILQRHAAHSGVEFMHQLIAEFDVKIGWKHARRLPDDGRALFVSNHPLGGLDGICLAHLLGRHYSDVRYIVNDILYHLRPLQSIFLPVNTIGAQRRDSLLRLSEALASALPVVSFPAGYCSRLIDGRVQDIPWSKSFVRMAIEHQRDVVPIFFDGLNSRRFYHTELWRKRLGLKFNLGTALLPDEMFRAKGRSFSAIVGESIPWQRLAADKRHHRIVAAEIRSEIYRMGEEPLRPK